VIECVQATVYIACSGLLTCLGLFVHAMQSSQQRIVGLESLYTLLEVVPSHFGLKVISVSAKKPTAATCTPLKGASAACCEGIMLASRRDA